MDAAVNKLANRSLTVSTHSPRICCLWVEQKPRKRAMGAIVIHLHFRHIFKRLLSPMQTDNSVSEQNLSLSCIGIINFIDWSKCQKAHNCSVFNWHCSQYPSRSACWPMFSSDTYRSIWTITWIRWSELGPDNCFATASAAQMNQVDEKSNNLVKNLIIGRVINTGRICQALGQWGVGTRHRAHTFGFVFGDTCPTRTRQLLSLVPAHRYVL